MDAPGLLDRLREHPGKLVILALSILLGVWAWTHRPLAHPPGILVPTEPEQTPVENPTPWLHRGHRFFPLARFQVQARILGVERYRFDPAAHLSPVDYALGWGPMSDSAVLDRLDIDQSGRWYHYRWRNEPPIPLEEIIRHSANMHLIPANHWVERQLLKARKGQLVALRGMLVRIEGPNGFHWVSSTTRTDSGDGSCEVIWVEEVRWLSVGQGTP